MYHWDGPLCLLRSLKKQKMATRSSLSVQAPTLNTDCRLLNVKLGHIFTCFNLERPIFIPATVAQIIPTTGTLKGRGNCVKLPLFFC